MIELFKTITNRKKEMAVLNLSSKKLEIMPPSSIIRTTRQYTNIIINNNSRYILEIEGFILVYFMFSYLDSKWPIVKFEVQLQK